MPRTAATARAPKSAAPLPRTVVHATDEVVDVKSWARAYVREFLAASGWRVRASHPPAVRPAPEAA